MHRRVVSIASVPLGCGRLLRSTMYTSRLLMIKRKEWCKVALSKRSILCLSALVVLVLTGMAVGASPGRKGYVIGYSAPYLTPSWMQITTNALKAEIDRLTTVGVVSDMIIGNANGDTSLQIAQLQGMIDKKVDAIILVAGSATALNPVVEKAHAAGIVVVNFDSLVSTGKVTSKVGVTWSELGTETAEWLAKEIGSKSKIIAVYGPAGVSVAEDIRESARAVFAKRGVDVVAEVRANNPAPAEIAVANALAANPNIDGVYSYGWGNCAGALRALIRAKRPLVPIVGENYNAFLKLWAENSAKGFRAMATGEPNDVSTLSLHVALRALEGHAVPKWVEVPRPTITNESLGNYVPNDKPDDYFLYTPMTLEEIEKTIDSMNI